MIAPASSLGSLAPYPFAELETQARAARQRGEPVVDLSIGDPDLPPPEVVVEALREAVRRPELHGYSSSRGEPFFREAIARWYARRFGVALDPEREVCALLGSKEGIANLARAYVEPGATVLCPDPGYPVYTAGATRLSGGAVRPWPLAPPRYDFTTGPFDDGKVRLAFLNYPSNPTGAIASKEEMRRAVDAARAHGALLASDLAYSELAADPSDAPSALAVDGAKECTIEFHSLSKTFAMTGFRLGFAVGNAAAIASLARLKSQVDSGPPKFLQWAGTAALELYAGGGRPTEVARAVATYQRRLARLVRGLRDRGLRAEIPKATFYAWHPVPGDGTEFARRLAGANVYVTPGAAFGASGARYVRWAVTRPEEEIAAAIERLDATAPGWGT